MLQTAHNKMSTGRFRKNNIEKCMEEKGWDAEKLAAETGFTRQAVCSWITNKGYGRGPYRKHQGIVADALGKTIQEVFPT